MIFILRGYLTRCLFRPLAPFSVQTGTMDKQVSLYRFLALSLASLIYRVQTVAVIGGRLPASAKFYSSSFWNL